MTALVDIVKADPYAIARLPSIDEHVGPGYTTRVVYRVGHRQMEHVRLDPNVEVPMHRHPHIDSVEIYVRGTFLLAINDHRFLIGPHIRPSRRVVVIRHDQYHGGIIGADGAEFISVQEWTEEPTSVVVDWEGPAEITRRAR